MELLLTGQNKNFEFNKGVNFMNVQKKIKLTALTCEDLKIFSYLCQDGIFSKDELMFDKKEGFFLATFSIAFENSSFASSSYFFKAASLSFSVPAARCLASTFSSTSSVSQG